MLGSNFGGSFALIHVVIVLVLCFFQPQFLGPFRGALSGILLGIYSGLSGSTIKPRNLAMVLLIGYPTLPRPEQPLDLKGVGWLLLYPFLWELR